MSKAIDEVRAKEAKELKAQGEEARAHRQSLVPAQAAREPHGEAGGQAQELLACNLKAVRAYLLKEDFQWLLGLRLPSLGRQFLDAWCRRTMRSRLKPMKKVAKMLRAHRRAPAQLVPGQGQVALGAVEGFNNKAKVTTRKAYGFRSFELLKIALYHTLGDLPEPEVTHKFC